MGPDVTASLAKLAHLVSTYKWLLDSYVIEFFTEHHWSKLPETWQESLSTINLPELCQLLLNCDERPQCNKSVSKVYPLSLLAFSAASYSLSLPRRPSPDAPLPRESRAQLDGLDHLYRCHLKPKKQHEIKVFGEVIHQLALRTNCRRIIDIGSGQGHLARYLAYNYGLDVTAVECVGDYLTTAATYDKNVEKSLVKRAQRVEPSVSGDNPSKLPAGGRLTHIEAMVLPGSSIENLLSVSESSASKDAPDQPAEDNPPATGCACYQSSSEQLLTQTSSCHNITPTIPGSHDTRCILVGLHTCGDLAPTILRAFAQSGRVVGVASVGCCYMKLTCESGDVQQGYPMSKWAWSLGCDVSYEAREVACHSIEMYKERLKGGPDSFDHLKVHCHRAAVEILLRKRGLRRTQVRISKRVSKFPFKEYARTLLQSVGFNQATPTEQGDEDLESLSQLVDANWQKVVVFFMLRLTLAPCVESIILLDRAQFLMEQGYKDVTLAPLFDPELSPRNHVVMAM